MHFDRIDAALEGLGPYKGKAYFFRGSQYVRYDWKLDREDFGYLQSISVWKLPSDFQSGIDAAVNGQGDYASKAYFFKGNKYARYDWNTDTVDLIDQDIVKWKLPDRFLSGIDAVLNGQGAYRGMTYFFKDDQYVRYNWKTDSVDVGPASITAWVPEEFKSGIQAAINGNGPFEGKAYFFKDNKYARFNWTTDRPDSGYPQPIEGNWKHGVSIWANIDTAVNVGRDARLREDDGSTLSLLPYPKGTTRGQAGWDVGISFGSLKSLRQKLHDQPIALPNFICGHLMDDCESLKAGQISRLAINAHGESGEISINGNHNPVKLSVLTFPSDPDIVADLAAIRDVTDPTATILFVGCRAGHSLGGTALLTALSSFMPGRKIVAFSTIGYSNGGAQARHGSGGVTEPGMRDTEYAFPSSSEQEEGARYGPIWKDLNALPWASEFSPHAKVALNGEIIRGAEL